MGRVSGDEDLTAPRSADSTRPRREDRSPLSGSRFDLSEEPLDDAPAARRGDPATRRLAIGAAVLAGGLVVAVGAWSMLHRHHHGVVVISAPVGPVRVKPLNPGGMQLTALPTMNMDSDGKPTLAPAPEQPNPQILQKQVDDARRDADAAEAPAPAAKVGPEQDSTAPTKTAPQTDVKTDVKAAAPTAPDAPESAPEPTPAPVPASRPNTKSSPTAIKPGAQSAASDAVAAPATGAQQGGQQVQLGALASETSARAEWKRLATRAPSVMSGHAPMLDHVTKGGLSIWRLRTGGFATTAQASEFCVQVRAAGGACTLANF